MNGFFTGLLTYANIAAAVSVVTVISNKLNSLNKVDNTVVLSKGVTVPEHLRPTVEYRNQLLSTYLDAINNRKDALLDSCCTPLCAEDQRKKAELCAKVQVRRELIFTPKKEDERTLSNAVVDEEQLVMFCETLTGPCAERYIDAVSGKVLEEKKSRGATVQLWMSSVDDRWVVSAVTVIDHSVDELLPRILGVLLAIGMFFPLVIPFLVNKSPIFQSLTSIFNVVVWIIAAVYLVGTLYTFSKDKKLVKTAPQLPQAYRIANAAGLLVRRLCLYRELYPAGAQPLLSPEAYLKWCKSYCHDGQYILDCLPTFNEQSITDAPLRDGRQLVDMWEEVHLTLLTSDRTILHVKRELGVQLYHNLSSANPEEYRNLEFQCSGCRQTIVANWSGVCPHCGQAFDLADYDWKLSNFDPMPLMDWGGKTYGDASLLNG